MAQMKLLVAAAIITSMMLINGIAAQTSFTVGDDMGWTVPDNSPDFYSTWATKHNFAVGDILVFQFPTGFHDVAEVTKAGYDDCDAGGVEAHTDGPVEITLDRSGSYFFICTFGNGGHCNNGQKLAINVTSAAKAPSPAAISTSPADISPSPVPEQAPSDLGSSPPMLLTSTFFSVSFISFLMALLH